MFFRRLRDTKLPDIVFLAVLSGLVYLPWIKGLTYNKDDWYFLYSGLVSGPEIFRAIALHTRPIRGPLYEFYFSLFGLHPYPYHLVLYFTRLLGGIGALWLFTLLWPKQRFPNFILAFLFLIFPGFLWWVSGFEFQPYVLSVSLEVLSFAFTLKSIESTTFIKRTLWLAGALLFGWIYLALVEYAIGMELFRILLVYVFIRDRQAGLSFWDVAPRVIRSAAIFLVIPLGFVFWYQFLFDNWRKAQSAGTQLNILLESVSNIVWFLVRLAQSTINVSFLAWVVPFYDHGFNGRLSQLLFGLFFAMLILGILHFVYHYFEKAAEKTTAEESIPEHKKWQIDAIVIGFIGTVGGVLPVVIANRIAVFDRFSHYTLPASFAGILFVGGWIFLISPKIMRQVALSIIVGIAALTHHAIATDAANEQKIIRDFWWQVTWRAPSINKDALLVVVYPDLDYGDGDEVAWGPANFIYYPSVRQPNDRPVAVTLAAIRMEPDAMREVILGNRVVKDVDRVVEYNSLTYNYKNILILTQPSEKTCVHALDNRWAGVSSYDNTFVLAGSKNSNIENIVKNSSAVAPPPYLFGSEPEHDWCYYFQKADYARQNGDWEEVIKMDQGAVALGLAPQDAIEWMPFLQAYSIAGNMERVRQIARLVKKDVFYKQQACQNLQALSQNGYSLSPEMNMMVDQLFCSVQ